MSLDRPIEGDLAARLFGGDPARALALVRAAWPLAVGAELARRTELLALEGATLRVRVPDAGWRKALHRMQGPILARLRDVAGSLAPRRLGFHEGHVTPPPPRPAPPPAPAETPPLPSSLAACAEAIPDPEIREAFRAAAARYLARSRHA